ncbi:MAG: hypothetical protein BGO67_05305 [Alphaproteobacteria bacterium 41-28]|nr:MAG: hypothetical protein BGO67_05305 [Alphaproteobacteria bacterium 41-28]
MKKLNCTSREALIVFIENTDKLLSLKKYYFNLLICKAFEEKLKNILTLKTEKNPTCLIIAWQDEALPIPMTLINHLREHLKSAGVDTSLELQQAFPPRIQKPHKNHHIIYIIPCIWLDSDQKKLDQFQGIRTQNNVHFVFSEQEKKSEIPKEIKHLNYIHLTEKNYYLAVFEILQKIYSNTNIRNIILEFEKKCHTVLDLTEFKYPSPSFEKEILQEKEAKFIQKDEYILKHRKWILLSAIFIIFLLTINYLIFYGKEKYLSSPIRSDLIIPTESTLLHRPELFALVDNKFNKRHEDIQTIALVGIGGSGKTTFARQYAREQKANVIWEMNAETTESLRESFEDLAQALSKEEEDQKKLREIQEIKNLEEKEKKMILFVKDLLRRRSNWFLVFDNVEKFTDIQKHFPRDMNTWGKGRIILTTRNDNFQNNNYIDHLVYIGELNSQQKLDLFTKIMNIGNLKVFNQNNESQIFLEKISPFPLDISIAAYYIKATNVSYEKYLECLNQHQKEFIDTLENILKESGEYNKTRYKIITLSLERLIKINKNFEPLLLFISLLDSQDIPQGLLEMYMGPEKVRNFIYHLKKFSLITNKLFHSESTLSIHRHTQKIHLAYFTSVLKLKENHQLIQSITDTLEKYIREAINKENNTSTKLSEKHAKMFLAHSNLLTDSMKGAIAGELGRIYIFKGDYTQGIRILEDSIIALSKSYNKIHIKVAHVLGYLGLAHRDIGNYKKAKDFLEQSYLIYNQQTFKNYSEIAWILTFLGDTHRELGDYNKAKDLLEESLIIYRNHLPENSAGVARVLTWLGMVYREAGNYQKARDLLEESYKSFKSISETHTGVAMTLAFLGNINNELGYHKKAKELLERSLVVYKKHFSEEHVAVARAFAFLGDVNGESGQYKEGKGLLEKSLMTFKKKLSEEHTYITWALAHLGIIYRELGDYDKAKNFFEKSLKRCEKYDGKNSVKTAYILRNLGHTYLLEGNTDVAENLIIKSLDTFYQNKHPESFKALESLAEVYLKKSIDFANKGDTQVSQKFKTQALNSLKQSLVIVKTHFPKKSPHVARIQSKLQNLE